VGRPAVGHFRADPGRQRRWGGLLSWLSAKTGYNAGKAAALSVTNGLRALLAPAGTLVTGLHLAFTDTDMTVHLDVPKNNPRDVASDALDGLLHDATEVLADSITRGVKEALAGDPRHLALHS
jgi:NAD(P)-dependent dehydrogenase (short-subunit alcohol dehydrogenase family)